MVAHIPDPPREEPSVNPPSDLAAIVASDSEEEEDGHYDGYTILPADPNEEENESEEEEETEIISSQPIETPVEPSTFDKATTDEKIALWSSPVSAESNMSTEQSDAVLKAMEGFKLPSSAVPPWAVDVKEEEWKNHLLSKIRSSP